MRKSLLAVGALAALSLYSCGGGNNGGDKELVQKWEAIYDASGDKMRDSFYNVRMQSIDTLTVFPEDVIAMKKELAKMPKDSLATVPAELVEMLQINDIAQFKDKMRESLKKSKHEEDSILANRKVIYEFRKDSVIKMYATDNLNMGDSSTMFTPDFKSKKIHMFGNPKYFQGEGTKDTATFDILFLNSDSMSLRVDTTGKGGFAPDIKPMNFRKYKEAKK